MGTQNEGGLVSRAVREALGTLVSPQVSTQVVERALSAAGLTAIPEGGPALAAWIEGPLRTHVESCVGSDGAELVSAQLAPILAHAANARAPAAAPKKPAAGRASFGSDQPTGIIAQPPTHGRRAQPADERRGAAQAPDGGNTRRPQGFQVEPRTTPARRVLTASSAPESVAALQLYLGDAARVEQVPDLVSLLDALEEPDENHPIVVVDCQRPTVHVTSIAAIGEDLPKGTTVVLWGSSEATWKDLDRDRMPNCRWVRCSQEATSDDVGSLCAMLIG